jgi:glycosyltransferase involved in cell wall biosynthesis
MDLDDMHQCNICGNFVEKFIPYRGGFSAISELQQRLKIIGSDVDNFSCPHCGCHDRERHLKMYIEKTGILEGKKKIKILHFAPERNILNFLAKFNPEIHILADLYTSDPRFEKINIEAIPYDNSSFDLIIANHILEHVDNPNLALFEINRVLKDDGIAILQTPYSQLLQNTFEDKAINDPQNRLYFYGQEDHVRVFGRDIFETINNFLVSNTVSHNDIFDSKIAKIFGVNDLEPFFLFRHRAYNDNKISKISSYIENKEKFENNPQVSICCITYNHEEFIEKAINSFLMQKTTFPFEIVVGEDGGTDKTLAILEKLIIDNPGRIRLLPRERNMGMHKNLMRTLNASTGRYIALCEGDDYWTDCEKLQKQWQYLESNPDCVATQSNVHGVREGQIDFNYVGGAKHDLTAEQLLTCSPMNTLTVMFRNVLNHLPQEFLTAGPGDLFIWSLIGHYGYCHYMQEILPSIYNIHDGGVHSKKSHHERVLMRLKTSYSLYLYYSRINNEALANYFLAAVESDSETIGAVGGDILKSLNELPDLLREVAGDNFNFDSKKLSEIITKNN